MSKLNFSGKWKTRNGTIVVVQVNPNAGKGDREIRYEGYIKPGGLMLTYNENAECVRAMNGDCLVVDAELKGFDLMNNLDGMETKR